MRDIFVRCDRYVFSDLSSLTITMDINGHIHAFGDPKKELIVGIIFILQFAIVGL